MATKFRRLQITLDSEVDRVLSDLSQVTGKPQATLVREWLAQAAPVMGEMVAALALAQESPKRAVQRMIRVADESVIDVQQQMLPFRRKRGRPRKRG